jgi:hypothetical protein
MTLGSAEPARRSWAARASVLTEPVVAAGSLLAISDFLDNRIRVYTIPPYQQLTSGNGGFWSGHHAKLAKKTVSRTGIASTHPDLRHSSSNFHACG